MMYLKVDTYSNDLFYVYVHNEQLNFGYFHASYHFTFIHTEHVI